MPLSVRIELAGAAALYGMTLEILARAAVDGVPVVFEGGPVNLEALRFERGGHVLFVPFPADQLDAADDGIALETVTMASRRLRALELREQYTPEEWRRLYEGNFDDAPAARCAVCALEAEHSIHGDEEYESDEGELIGHPFEAEGANLDA